MHKYILAVFTLIYTLPSFSQNWVPHAFAENNNNVGYIDSITGETKVYWHFDSAKAFRFGLAAACFQGKWGCFNNKGEVIIPFAFKSLTLVSDSIVNVDYEKGWDNEIYFLKGKFAGYVVSNYGRLADNNNFYHLIPVFKSESKIQKIIVIDSDAKKKALLTYQDEVALNELRQSVMKNSKQPSNIWHSFQLSTYSFQTEKEKGSSGRDFKAGCYFANKFLLTGVNIGFQRSKVEIDTFKQVTDQLPLMWSNYVFLKKNPLGSACYAKFDFGCILGTFDYKKNTKTNRSSYVRNTNAPNLIMNIGMGLKVGEEKSKAGITVEAGYKFMPIYIAYKTYVNHVYFSIGVLL